MRPAMGFRREANPYRKEAGAFRRDEGFTLVELLVSLVLGGMLLTAVYKIWINNHNQTDRIQTKSDFRDKSTLATTRLNSSILMAGFGMAKMEVIQKVSADSTDTLTLYSNASEIRTTLKDTARSYSSTMLIFKDTGFVVGSYIAITDSLHQEYNRIASKSGDTASGFTLTLQNPLANTYVPGVPDIYPVHKERFFIQNTNHSLVRYVDDGRSTLVQGIQDFRVSLLDKSGNPAVSYKTIRVVTFNMTGTYKAPAGTPNLMRFSSTVIPRNIL